MLLLLKLDYIQYSVFSIQSWYMDVEHMGRAQASTLKHKVKDTQGPSAGSGLKHRTLAWYDHRDNRMDEARMVANRATGRTRFCSASHSSAQKYSLAKP